MALTDWQKQWRHLSGRKSWLGKSGPIAQRVPSPASDRDNCHHRTDKIHKTSSQKKGVATRPFSECIWPYSAHCLNVPKTLKAGDMAIWRFEDYCMRLVQMSRQARAHYFTHSLIQLQFSKRAMTWPDHPVTRCDDFYLHHCPHWLITEEMCLG